MHWDKYTRRSSVVDARVLPGHSSLLCSIVAHVLVAADESVGWLLVCFCGDVCSDIPRSWNVVLPLSLTDLGSFCD